MARSRVKAGGACTGKFKPKKMGKGYSTNRKQPIGSRPVLRLTEPDSNPESGAKKGEEKSEG